MDELRLRLATAADAPVLAALRFEFRTALAPQVTAERGFHERCAAWMASRLAGGGAWRCWIAAGDLGEADDVGREAIGMVWVQLIEKLPNPVGEPELHAYLTSFYVRPAARNRGVGSALLDAALAECAARGCDSVFLWPTPRSRALYLRRGFTERGGVLELAVSAGRPPASGS